MKFNSTKRAILPLYRSPPSPLAKKFSRRKKISNIRKRSARSSNQRSCQFPWNFTRANIDHRLTGSSRLQRDSYQFSFQFFPPPFHPRTAALPPSPPRCGKIRLLRSHEFSIYWEARARGPALSWPTKRTKRERERERDVNNDKWRGRGILEFIAGESRPVP